MLLSVNRLTKSFSGLTAINELNQSIDAGEVVGLIGPNGAGKTTFFNLISGFLAPTKGQINFKGQDITGLKPHKINHLGIARTFQIVKPLQRMTLLENVMVGAFIRSKDPKKVRQRALEVLEFTGQIEKKDAVAGSLTLVERKKMEISRALATKPDLLLLDECMAGLNSKEIQDASDLIRKISDRGVTMIIIEHVIKAIMSVSDRIVVLNYGEKLMEGDPESVLTNKQVIEAYLGGDYAQCH